ncbi:hypothetical protein [Companilactobacillus nodensis]|uniref:Uncharacterized protein n=1 Tax=Companilactobacillus nodensis DSM 19682 = JCM 14932 = NBRC 107160 TaxID=1423775 RepID=A0A0R1KCD2_9LACO|nr:hypothetical protein [Companilactobacillus nodensis]KRK81136.1 hypothetical protein FD03_GL000728 [Companilactobacillus nodensis DSM 19682 = JCM 14932 = NBRC 107160]
MDDRIHIIETGWDDLMEKKWFKWIGRIGIVVLIAVLVFEASWMKVWCADVFLKLGGYDLFESLVKSAHIIRHFLDM